MSLFIRQENNSDIAAVHEVESLAFGRRTEADIVDGLRGTKDFIPGLSLVAVKDGAIVGHILFSRATIEATTAVTPVVMLAPLAVYPQHQRQGVDSALVKAGLEGCIQLGHKVIILFGHPSYYPRFGFKPAGAFGLRPPLECPPEAFMALELVPGSLNSVQGIVRFSKVFKEV